EDVRTDAAAALGLLADPDTADRLMDNLLGDPCHEVKMAAIEALVALRHQPLVPWLRRLARSRDEDVVWDEDAFYQDGWDDWLDVQLAAIDGLAAFGAEEAVPDIEAAIGDEFGQDLTEYGFRALGRLGVPGIAALGRYLETPNERTRRRAAAILAGIGDEAAAPAVARALADPSADVRLATVQAVIKRDPRSAALRPLFEDPHSAIRAEVVRHCGHAHPELTSAALTESSARVVVAALEVMARHAAAFGGRDIEVAEARLGEPAPEVKAAAIAAFAAAAPDRALPILRDLLADTGQMQAVRPAAVQALGRMAAGEAVAALAACLGDGDRQLRLEAIGAMGRLARQDPGGENPARETLLAALRGELVAPPEAPDDPPETVADDEEQAQPMAAEEGGETEDDVTAPAFPTSTLAALTSGDQEAEELLAAEPPELTEEDREYMDLAGQRKLGKKRVAVTPQVAPHLDVRRFAARVLGDLFRPEVAEALAEAMAVGDAELRLAAADSLAHLAENGVVLRGTASRAMLDAAADEEPHVRLSAIRALATVDDGEAGTALTALLRDADGTIRTAAITALATTSRVDDQVVACLDDGDPSVRQAAAKALAGSGRTDALDRLVDFAFAEEGYHRRQAGALLRSLDLSRANARMLAVLRDDQRRRVWAVPIEVLEELNGTADGKLIPPAA
ncbi:MAG: HEAT repeat domain-containing protein, partial [Alphaproteobacteria bacterium]|nr:HEAT repeat domain-containing protein [Alphaproteobacteria bacterium]